MRKASHRAPRTLITATAAVLLLPVAATGPARADSAYGPTAFTGTAILPDGVTLAPAAVVDLSLPGGAAFARAVSGPDGTFSLDIPETGELVVLAHAGGGQVTVNWLLSKLFTASQAQPGRGLIYEQTPTPQAGGLPAVDPGDGVIVPNPRAIYARETGKLVLTLVNEAAGRVARLLDNKGDLEFHTPAPQTGKIVSKVADIIHAAGVYQDPDLIAGKEDLNDPDVIPPLFSELFHYEVLDGDSVCGTDVADLGLVTEGCPSSTQESDGCKIAETWLTPARGAEQMRGTASTATLRLHHCTNEVDSKADYWAWAWQDARVTNVDTNEEYTYIWRYKLRTELVSNRKVHGVPAPYDTSKYYWDDVNPDQDRSDGGEWQLHWTAGFEKGVTGSVSGDYTVLKAKKIHRWDDGRTNEHRTFHVSWISNTPVGSRGAWFQSGGGMHFVVPQGEKKSHLRTATNTYDIWRCWIPKNPPMAYSCDPQD